MKQKTYDALFDYCEVHEQAMATRIEIISNTASECGGIYGKDNILW